MGKKKKQKHNQLTHIETSQLLSKYIETKDAQYKDNYRNAYNGLQTGRIKMKNDEDGSLVCVFGKSNQCIGLGSYEELCDTYLESFNKIVKGKNIKIIDGEIFCSVEAFYKNFKIEDIANLITLSVETCDCMCSYEHCSRLLRGL